MSAPQLVAAYDELMASDVPPEFHTRFETHLVGTLARKDPELALDHFRGRVTEDSGTAMLLLSAFREWAAKSPLRAERWLDARIQDQTFTNKTGREEPARLHYERELLRGLLVIRPEAAAARLEALPEADRSAALTGIEVRHNPAPYVVLLRRYLPEAERDAELVRLAETARQLEGDDAVAEWMDRVSATPEEREMVRRRLKEPGDAGSGHR